MLVTNMKFISTKTAYREIFLNLAAEHQTSATSLFQLQTGYYNPPPELQGYISLN